MTKAETHWMREAIGMIRDLPDVEWDPAREHFTLGGMPLSDGQIVEWAISLGKAPLPSPAEPG